MKNSLSFVEANALIAVSAVLFGCSGGGSSGGGGGGGGPTKIAFTSERDGNDEIYVMNADGSGQTNLTNDAAVDCSPAWRP